MKKKIFLVLLIIFFIFPVVTFGAKTQWPLKKVEIQKFF